MSEKNIQEFVGLKIRNVEIGNVLKDVAVPVCAITFQGDEDYYCGMNIKLILKGKYAKAIYNDYLKAPSEYLPKIGTVAELNCCSSLEVNVVAEFRELRKNEVVFHNPQVMEFIDINSFVSDEYWE